MHFHFRPAPASFGGPETGDALLGTILEPVDDDVRMDDGPCLDDGGDDRDGNDDKCEGEDEEDAEEEDRADRMGGHFWPQLNEVARITFRQAISTLIC